MESVLLLDERKKWVECSRCEGTGRYRHWQCVRCGGKGNLDRERLKFLIEDYWPGKIKSGWNPKAAQVEIDELIALLRVLDGETDGGGF